MVFLKWIYKTVSFVKYNEKLYFKNGLMKQLALLNIMKNNILKVDSWNS